MIYSFLCILLGSLCTLGAQDKPEYTLPPLEDHRTLTTNHILYLAQGKNYTQALSAYQKRAELLGKEDFETLEAIARIILEHSTKTSDPKQQLLSIYACSLAGMYIPSYSLESSISSSDLTLQLASLHFLAKMQDDRLDALLQKAMSSEFLYTRLEAAYILSAKKARSAAGQIEALMYKLPPQLHFFFPELFAIIGNKQATEALKQLLCDGQNSTRIEAILSAARHSRDDLLPIIRKSASHHNIAEQEASAYALGILQDSSSLQRLRKLADAPTDTVALAALLSLYQLGEVSAKENIMSFAKKNNVFAIALCSNIEGSELLLQELCKTGDSNIRLNASLSLLRRRDPSCLHHLNEFLLYDSKDLGFLPHQSIGGALRAWKVVASATQHSKIAQVDLISPTQLLREKILTDAIELPEKYFLQLARTIFDTNQTALIPLTISLLENHSTPEAIALLKEKSQSAGAPLVRGFCNLSLWRLKQEGDYRQRVERWLITQKDQDIIRFKSYEPWALSRDKTSFELTAEESSMLMIESFQTLAKAHDSEAIAFIVDALKTTSGSNALLLAGILLAALQ